MAKAEQDDPLAYEQRFAAGQLTSDDLRKERDVILDLYKHHLNLLLQANVFIYAVTGALLSFVFTHQDAPHLRWVLTFPVLFAGAFGFFFWKAREGIEISEQELDRIASVLKVHVYPKIKALRLGLSVSSLALLVMATLIVLGAFLIK